MRGFLLARDNKQIIVGLVSAMADSGLPCFKFPDTLKNVCGLCTSCRDSFLTAHPSLVQVLKSLCVEAFCSWLVVFCGPLFLGSSWPFGLRRPWAGSRRDGS